jgi:integrase
MKNLIKIQTQFGAKKSYNPESILGRAKVLLHELQRGQKKETSQPVGQNELSNSKTQQNKEKTSRTTPISKNPVSVAPPQSTKRLIFEKMTLEQKLNRIAKSKSGHFLNCAENHSQNVKLTIVKPAANIRIDSREIVAKIKTFSAAEIQILQSNISKTFPKLPVFQKRAKHEELNLIFALYQGCSLERKDILRLEMNEINFKKRAITIKRNNEMQPINKDLSEALYSYIHNFRLNLELNHDRLFFSSEPMLDKALNELQAVCENENIQSKLLNMLTLRHSIAAAHSQQA